MVVHRGQSICILPAVTDNVLIHAMIMNDRMIVDVGRRMRFCQRRGMSTGILTHGFPRPERKLGRQFFNLAVANGHTGEQSCC